MFIHVVNRPTFRHVKMRSGDISLCSHHFAESISFSMVNIFKCPSKFVLEITHAKGLAIGSMMIT